MISLCQTVFYLLVLYLNNVSLINEIMAVKLIPAVDVIMK